MTSRAPLLLASGSVVLLIAARRTAVQRPGDTLWGEGKSFLLTLTCTAAVPVAIPLVIEAASKHGYTVYSVRKMPRSTIQCLTGTVVHRGRISVGQPRIREVRATVIDLASRPDIPDK